MIRSMGLTTSLLLSVVCALPAVAHVVGSGVPSVANFSSLTGRGFFLVPEPVEQGKPLNTGYSTTTLDFDGDGYKDLAVSAHSRHSMSGRVYLVYGPIISQVQLPPSNASFGMVIDSSQTSTNFGYSISSGDLDGDSLEDLVIGSMVSPGIGTVAIVWGRRQRDRANITTAELIDSSLGVVYSGLQDDLFGYSVRVVPSVNGDQFSDIIIGAQKAAITPTTFPGAVYLIQGHNGLWLGSSTLGNSQLPPGVFKIWGDLSKKEFGYQVAGCKDINGDGIGDMVISCGVNCREVYVVFGRTDGMWPSDMAQLDGTNGFSIQSTENSFGVSTDCGDFNGDGLSDLVIGSFVSAPVIFGRNGTWPKRIDLSATKLDGSNGFTARGFGLPFPVRDLGDVNGDGVNDLGIGASTYSAIALNANGFHVLYGQRSLWNSSVNLTSLDQAATGFVVLGTEPSEHAGFSLANNPGNIDGDSRGLCDIIAGAPFYDSSKGRVAVVKGTFWPLNCKLHDPTTGGCSSCHAGFGVVQGACVSCSSIPNSFIDGYGDCHSCVTENCTECTYSGTCTKCKQGYLPSGVNMSCTEHHEASVVVVFDPNTGVTTNDLAADIATAIGVPIQLVTVTIIGNGEVLVTIKGSGAQDKADTLAAIINNQQCG